MARLAVRDFGTALNFTGSSTNVVSAPYTFPTDAFTYTFWYKQKSPMASNETICEQAGSFAFYRQGLNDVQIYAYLNAPADFAGLRRLRFRNMRFLGAGATNAVGDGFSARWHQRAYVLYVLNGAAKCDEYEDGVKLGATHTVDYTGDTGTPSGNLFMGNSFGGASSAVNAIFDNIVIYNTQLTAAQVLSLYLTGQDPVAPGAKWLFNEASGTTVLDSSGNNKNATITGATYTTDVPMIARGTASNRFQVPTTYQTALNLNASTALVNMGDLAAFRFTTTFSLSAWIKPATLASTFSGIISKRSAATDYSIELAANNALRFFTTTSITGNESFVTGNNVVPVGVWSHVLATWDGTTKRIYVNGVSVGTPSTATGTLTLGSIALTVGNLNSPTFPLIGSIKDARVFNRCLTSGEAVLLATNQGSAVSRTGLVGEYLTNEGAGPTAYDTSGNGNNGTITGATYTRDTPMQPRAKVGGNMVFNGDFEYAPPFTAATTTTAWIDGTASGSSTNDIFRWAVVNRTAGGTFSAQFEQGMMRLDAAVTGSQTIRLINLPGTTGVEPYTPVAEVNRSYLYPLLPSTSYTITGKLKTSITMQSGAGMFSLNFSEHKGSLGAQVARSNIVSSAITQILTPFSYTFTTNTLTRYLSIDLTADGGLASLTGTVWIDDITLTPTVNTTRLPA